MVLEVMGPISYITDNSDHITRALRWLNLAQKDLALMDWPELITNNATFTTDGSENYDLTSEIDPSFLRIKDKSIRIAFRNIEVHPKGFVDQIDPDRTFGNLAYACGLESRTFFWLWPAESSGEVVTLDWIKEATAITNSLSEADNSFDADRHDLIVGGALWRAFRRERDQGMNWMSEKREYERTLKEYYSKHVGRIRIKSAHIKARRF